MSTQSEYALEDALIAQLKGMEYSPVRIDGEADMLANLKRQLEIHNQDITLTTGEFERILNHLNTGNVFERAKVLRDRFALKRDNDETVWLTFLNCTDWCMNEFQVTHQTTMEGKRKNRYDVTLLINGLPPWCRLNLNGAVLNLRWRLTRSIVISTIRMMPVSVYFSTCSCLLSVMA